MNCTTHHRACDCREREREADRRELYAANAILAAVRRILDVPDGDDIIVAARAVVNAARKCDEHSAIRQEQSLMDYMAGRS